MDYSQQQYYQQQTQPQFYGSYPRPAQQIQPTAPGYVCKPVTSREEAVATSTDYFSLVVTSATGAAFRMIGNPCCSPSNNLAAVDAATGGVTA